MSVPDNPKYPEEQVNKRRTTRAPLIIEKIPCDDGHKTFFGYAKNISRGGLFVSTLKPRELGEVFLIEWSLPTTPRYTVRCRCEVIWTRGFQRNKDSEPGMGLRFLDLADADGDKIDAWVGEYVNTLA